MYKNLKINKKQYKKLHLKVGKHFIDLYDNARKSITESKGRNVGKNGSDDVKNSIENEKLEKWKRLG